jgi:hypothetical protein
MNSRNLYSLGIFLTVFGTLALYNNCSGTPASDVDKKLSSISNIDDQRGSIRPDEQTLQIMIDHNRQKATLEPLSDSPWTDMIRTNPFAEYEKTGYVFFNLPNPGNGVFAPWMLSSPVNRIRDTIASTLPKDVKLVVYTTSQDPSEVEAIREHFENLRNPEDLIILRMPPLGGNPFWSRDALPVPVWELPRDRNLEMQLVDSRYYHNFEPDEFLSQLFGSLLNQVDYFFEGGNLIANQVGDCIIVNRISRTGQSYVEAIPDYIFQRYGCRTLVRLPHIRGIGHADEVVKFMSHNLVVTDTDDFADRLESAGFQVHLLPQGPRVFESYVNSLLVNDTLYVPAFGDPKDDIAVNVYRNLGLGLNIIKIPSRRLVAEGSGGIHCITANYPPVPLATLLEKLKVQ